MEFNWRQMLDALADVVVAVSGYGEDENRRRSREAGFDLHLTKPVNADELEQVLAEPRFGAGPGLCVGRGASLGMIHRSAAVSGRRGLLTTEVEQRATIW
jgi:CheY-like chemotaxis protein